MNVSDAQSLQPTLPVSQSMQVLAPPSLSVPSPICPSLPNQPQLPSNIPPKLSVPVPSTLQVPVLPTLPPPIPSTLPSVRVIHPTVQSKPPPLQTIPLSQMPSSEHIKHPIPVPESEHPMQHSVRKPVIVSASELSKGSDVRPLLQQLTSGGELEVTISAPPASTSVSSDDSLVKSNRFSNPKETDVSVKPVSSVYSPSQKVHQYIEGRPYDIHHLHQDPQLSEHNSKRANFAVEHLSQSHRTEARRVQQPEKSPVYKWTEPPHWTGDVHSRKVETATNNPTTQHGERSYSDRIATMARHAATSFDTGLGMGLIGSAAALEAVAQRSQRRPQHKMSTDLSSNESHQPPNCQKEQTMKPPGPIPPLVSQPGYNESKYTSHGLHSQMVRPKPVKSQVIRPSAQYPVGVGPYHLSHNYIPAQPQPPNNRAALVPGVQHFSSNLVSTQSSSTIPHHGPQPDKNPIVMLHKPGVMVPTNNSEVNIRGAHTSSTLQHHPQATDPQSENINITNNNKSACRELEALEKIKQATQEDLQRLQVQQEEALRALVRTQKQIELTEASVGRGPRTSVLPNTTVDRPVTQVVDSSHPNQRPNERSGGTTISAGSCIPQLQSGHQIITHQKTETAQRLNVNSSENFAPLLHPSNHSVSHLEPDSTQRSLPPPPPLVMRPIPVLNINIKHNQGESLPQRISHQHQQSMSHFHPNMVSQHPKLLTHPPPPLQPKPSAVLQSHISPQTIHVSLSQQLPHPMPHQHQFMHSQTSEVSTNSLHKSHLLPQSSLVSPPSQCSQPSAVHQSQSILSTHASNCRPLPIHQSPVHSQLSTVCQSHQSHTQSHSPSSQSTHSQSAVPQSVLSPHAQSLVILRSPLPQSSIESPNSQQVLVHQSPKHPHSSLESSHSQQMQVRQTPIYSQQPLLEIPHSQQMSIQSPIHSQTSVGSPHSQQVSVHQPAVISKSSLGSPHSQSLSIHHPTQHSQTLLESSHTQKVGVHLSVHSQSSLSPHISHSQSLQMPQLPKHSQSIPLSQTAPHSQNVQVSWPSFHYDPRQISSVTQELQSQTDQHLKNSVHLPHSSPVEVVANEIKTMPPPSLKMLHTRKREDVNNSQMLDSHITLHTGSSQGHPTVSQTSKHTSHQTSSIAVKQSSGGLESALHSHNVTSVRLPISEDHPMDLSVSKRSSANNSMKSPGSMLLSSVTHQENVSHASSTTLRYQQERSSNVQPHEHPLSEDPSTLHLEYRTSQTSRIHHVPAEHARYHSLSHTVHPNNRRTITQNSLPVSTANIDGLRRSNDQICQMSFPGNSETSRHQFSENSSMLNRHPAHISPNSMICYRPQSIEGYHVSLDPHHNRESHKLTNNSLISVYHIVPQQVPQMEQDKRLLTAEPCIANVTSERERYYPSNKQVSSTATLTPDQSSLVTCPENSMHYQPQHHYSCGNCDRPARFMCSACHKAWYCSANCQTQHWNYHTGSCRLHHK